MAASIAPGRCGDSLSPVGSSIGTNSRVARVRHPVIWRATDISISVATRLLGYALPGPYRRPAFATLGPVYPFDRFTRVADAAYPRAFDACAAMPD